MLRISVTTAEGTAVRLEGRLVGPWVDELDTCWRRLRVAAERPIRIDLDGVTFVDAAGKAALRKMHADGAVFTASSVMMRAVADEIACTGRAHRNR